MTDSLPEPFTLDLDRSRRCGFPEVVFGEGKCVVTLTEIFKQLLADNPEVLATRIAREKSDELLKNFPKGGRKRRRRKKKGAGNGSGEAVNGDGQAETGRNDRPEPNGEPEGGPPGEQSLLDTASEGQAVPGDEATE